MRTHGSQDHVEIAEDFLVPETKDRPSMFEEQTVSDDVGGVFEMLVAVTLDDQPM